MSCDDKNHHMHMCALKRQGLDDCIKSLSDKPTVECRQCGATANSSENLCAAHLGDWAPSVEGGHGTVGLDEVGKPHDGAHAGGKSEPNIDITQVKADEICGGY
jgi:hypothetical protein